MQFDFADVHREGRGDTLGRPSFEQTGHHLELPVGSAQGGQVGAVNLNRGDADARLQQAAQVRIEHHLLGAQRVGGGPAGRSLDPQAVDFHPVPQEADLVHLAVGAEGRLNLGLQQAGGAVQGQDDGQGQDDQGIDEAAQTGSIHGSVILSRRGAARQV